MRIWTTWAPLTRSSFLMDWPFTLATTAGILSGVKALSAGLGGVMLKVGAPAAGVWPGWLWVALVAVPGVEPGVVSPFLSAGLHPVQEASRRASPRPRIVSRGEVFWFMIGFLEGRGPMG